jgi:protein-tyrosine phosphatase
MQRSPFSSSRSHEQLSGPEGLSRRNFMKRSFQCALLPALASPWLTSCGSSSTLPPTPRLSSVSNFRDVAGADDTTAYRTASGQKLRRGIVYRSNALGTPSVPDQATLDSLGILKVYDLRTPDEITALQDTPPAGATDTNININGTPNVKHPTITTPDEAIAYMESSYMLFVTDAGVRGRIAQVLQGIANTPGNHLYHCSGGKDRTGWMTCTLQSIVGVPLNVIVQDYLLTNGYSQASIQAQYQQTIDADGQVVADITYPSLVADQRYLYAGLNQVTAQFGTMASYISDGLGLDAATQNSLRALLLS